MMTRCRVRVETVPSPANRQACFSRSRRCQQRRFSTSCESMAEDFGKDLSVQGGRPVSRGKIKARQDVADGPGPGKQRRLQACGQGMLATVLWTRCVLHAPARAPSRQSFPGRMAHLPPRPSHQMQLSSRWVWAFTIGGSRYRIFKINDLRIAVNRGHFRIAADVTDEAGFNQHSTVFDQRRGDRQDKAGAVESRGWHDFRHRPTQETR